jgi:DNA-binding HxlR family transcriptional regulator
MAGSPAAGHSAASARRGPRIVTDRLRRLVERGILDRQTRPSGKRHLCTLATAGRVLFTVIVFTVIVARLEYWSRQPLTFADARS